MPAYIPATCRCGATTKTSMLFPNPLRVVYGCGRIVEYGFYRVLEKRVPGYDDIQLTVQELQPCGQS